MIGIINYGLGNVRAFINAYEYMSIPVKLITKVEDFNNISHIILPGVGSFDLAMQQLEASGLRSRLEELVLKNSMPILGVCVGMQIMGLRSDEGSRDGLGWIAGNVLKITNNSKFKHFCLPHMGWNQVSYDAENRLFKNLSINPEFYFLHSFYFQPENSERIIATTIYFETIPCAVYRQNIFGVQFHPEKSHDAGMALLKNFYLTI